jgi:hypothetical protein
VKGASTIGNIKTVGRAAVKGPISFTGRR